MSFLQRSPPTIRCRSNMSREVTSLMHRLAVTPQRTAEDVSKMARSKQSCGERGGGEKMPSSLRTVDEELSEECWGDGTSASGISHPSPVTQEQAHPSPSGSTESPNSLDHPRGSSIQPVSDSSTSSSSDDLQSPVEEKPPVLSTRGGRPWACQGSSDGDTNVVDLREKLGMKRLVSSDHPSESGSDVSSGGSELSDSSYDDLDMGEKRGRTEPAASQQVCACKDMSYGMRETLQEFVKKIMYKLDSGVCVWDGMSLAVKSGVLQYKENEQYCVLKTLRQPEHPPYGVFLCQDLVTEHKFVLKKIPATNHRLVGTEFLISHQEDFLPKIYAVYKEKKVIWIFQEFIAGGAVGDCDWNLEQVYVFADRLLSAVRFIHQQGLAHCDLKSGNVMVRDPSRPDSFVIIDFESAKHPGKHYHFISGGHTPTYLPPWYEKEKLFTLETFTPLLKVADLWAVACMLLPFLSDKSDLHPHGRAIWAEVTGKLRQRCPDCKRLASGQFCEQCRDRFLHHLRTQGHEIVPIHLGGLLEQNIPSLHWISLVRLLRYLTDASYREINVHTALTKFHGKKIDSS